MRSALEYHVGSNMGGTTNATTFSIMAWKTPASNFEGDG